MFSTANFKTKTVFIPRRNCSVKEFWGVALDVGYSAVKGFSNNMVYCFPSYARKLSSPLLNIGEDNPKDIQYRGEDGTIWSVGESAQNMISSSETKDSNQSLYGRNRYYSDMFKVIARVGLAMGMLENQYNSPVGKTLTVQTGLPPAYLKSDTAMIQDVLSGTHNFSIKIGNKPWINFNFTLPVENISVMAQPMGTLFSIATDNYGHAVPDAAKYFRSNMLIMDPGFGTLDVFSIKNRLIESTETFDDLGMKRVLTETANEIFNKYHQEIKVPAMQKNLDTGVVMCFDRKARTTKPVQFGDILERASIKVCKEALNKIDSIYDNLFDHDYLVITGGTGAAWSEYIQEYYKGMTSLQVIAGSKNDNLSCVFSNVRGYYMYLISKLNKIQKKQS